MGMPSSEFAKLVMESFNAGQDEIIIGGVMNDLKTFNDIVSKRRIVFENLAGDDKGHGSQDAGEVNSKSSSLADCK